MLLWPPPKRQSTAVLSETLLKQTVLFFPAACHILQPASRSRSRSRSSRSSSGGGRGGGSGGGSRKLFFLARSPLRIPWLVSGLLHGLWPIVWKVVGTHHPFQSNKALIGPFWSLTLTVILPVWLACLAPSVAYAFCACYGWGVSWD